VNLTLPELCLVLLVGPSGAGKSRFAQRHFKPFEIVSSDTCRAWVSDDENDQSATADAFELVHTLVAKRLKRGRLTVVDATNVQPEARRSLIALARQYQVVPIALVFDLPLPVLLARHAARSDRPFGSEVIEHHAAQLRASIKGLEQEGLRLVVRWQNEADIDAVAIDRSPMPSNLRSQNGPFDIIGDVHGCFDELAALLTALGYVIRCDADRFEVSHPQQRRLVFLGDLVDRGPNTPGVLRLARAVVESGRGYCVAGNHDVKLAKALRGRAVKVAHGLEHSLAQLQGESADFRQASADFLESLATHYVLDGGRLVVAHAGLLESLHGRSSRREKSFALYGDTTGEVDSFGLPVRNDWARRYQGAATVVYGHTPVAEPQWVNNTLCIDTGCVFGGRLTALRYPERELVSVPALRLYSEPARGMGE
jgi:protein phosphatase